MIYKKFFAAQNSAKGFISRFDELFFEEGIRRRFIIKGGAGTGKSTFLKALAAAADEDGHDVELYYCSSDVNSLDGVIIRDLGICALDATSPHAYDARYVGCVDTLLDVTRFLDSDELVGKTDEIKALSVEASRCFKSGYKSLKAAGELIEELYESGRIHIDNYRLERTALRLTKAVKGERVLNVRLVSAVNARGKTSLCDYFRDVKKAYLIEDVFVTAPLLMKRIEERARERVTAFADALMPDRYEAVYLEESKILISSEKSLLPEKFTRMAKSKFYDGYYARNKEKIRFEEKLIKALVDIASDSFKKAKKSHDALERINAPAMDFKAMDEWSRSFIKELLQDGRA